MNTNYYKLFPGAHLKPHFGNAPRLTAHLAVIAPEPLRSGISVGSVQSLWIEGKSMVIDDTFPHSATFRLFNPLTYPMFFKASMSGW